MIRSTIDYVGPVSGHSLLDDFSGAPVKVSNARRAKYEARPYAYEPLGESLGAHSKG